METPAPEQGRQLRKRKTARNTERTAELGEWALVFLPASGTLVRRVAFHSRVLGLPACKRAQQAAPLRDLASARRLGEESGSKLPHSTESRRGFIWSAAACRRFRGPKENQKSR